jgi:type IV secretory pathway TrbD component
MDVRIHDSTEICQGATRTRTMVKIPTCLCLGGSGTLGLLLYLNGLSWRSLGIVVVASLLYGWCVWQTKKDPQWLQTWMRHLQLKPVYRG